MPEENEKDQRDTTELPGPSIEPQTFELPADCTVYRVVEKTADLTRYGNLPAGHASYSLFLMTNLEWLSALQDADLRRLHAAYRMFGEAIGEDHVAVWFWKKGPEAGSESGPPITVENLDIARSADWARVCGLPVSEGPYVVLMRTYPMEARQRSDVPLFRVRLGDLDAGGIVKLLNVLATAVSDANFLDDVASKEAWLRLRHRLDNAGHALGRILDRVEFSLKVPFGELKLNKAEG